MRYFFILLLSTGFLLSCGGDTTPATNTTPPSAATTLATNSSIVASPDLIPLNNPKATAPNIEIKVENLNAGMAYLISFFQGQNYRLDSAVIDANGRMVFEHTEPYRSCFAYAVFPDQSNLQLLIDADQQFSMTTNKNNLVGAMKIDGSLDNQLLYENLQFQAGLQPKFSANSKARQGLSKDDPKMKQLLKERNDLIDSRVNTLNDVFEKHPNSFFTAFKSAGQNPDLKISDFEDSNGYLDTAAWVYNYRMSFWDGTNLLDERLLNTPVISNKLTKYIKELTPQHPDSIKQAASFLVDKTLNSPEYFKYFANWITMQYDPKESTLMDPQAVYVHMIQKYFTKERAVWSQPAEVQGLQMRAYEMAQSLLGQKAPEVEAPSYTGGLKTIYDLKKDYIIVYMYNPTCEHCMKESPKLVEFYKTYKNEVDIYGIAIDTDEKEWRDYVKKTGMDAWTNVFDPTNQSIYARYFVDVTPELYLLNKDRIIIGKNLKVDQVQTMIDRDKRLR
ncbi:MAG: peroxiredoxin [Paraglaciecola sp.]|jgi:peroxiredoxin